MTKAEAKAHAECYADLAAEAERLEGAVCTSADVKYFSGC